MEKFNFWVEADFEKSQSTMGSPDFYKNMVIWGQASTNDIDLDEEILEPVGYDLSTFLSKGLINYEHLGKKSALYYIGEPQEATVKDNKLFIKAKLWEKSQTARDLWDTLHIMKASNSTRKIGWSIEGTPLEKDKQNDKRITKARLTHTALTFMPKNANTWAEIVKGEQSEDFVALESNNDVLYEFEKGGEKYIMKGDLSISKAMTAGHETGTELVGKETSGASLKQESLDGVVKKVVENQDSIIKIANGMLGLEEDMVEKTKKSIKKFLGIE